MQTLFGIWNIEYILNLLLYSLMLKKIDAENVKFAVRLNFGVYLFIFLTLFSFGI